MSPVAQGPPRRAVPGPGDRRRLRLVGGRRPGLAAARAGRLGDRAWPGSPPAPARSRVRRRPRAGRAGLGRHRPGRQRRPAPARVPERPGEDGARPSSRSTAARYCFTGDMATVEDDGTIQLLGPRLAVHQHRRGEGLPRRGGGGAGRPSGGGRRAGGRRARRAVGQRRHRRGRSRPPGAARRWTTCGTTCRPILAGYKLPKHLVIVDAVVRSPAGKADYRWASSHRHLFSGADRAPRRVLALPRGRARHGCGRRERDRHRLVAADEVGRAVAGLGVVDQLEVGQAARAARSNITASSRRARLLPRQKWVPKPNATWSFGRAGDVEAERVVEHVLVAVGRRVEQQQLLALLDLLAARARRRGWRCGPCS